MLPISTQQSFPQFQFWSVLLHFSFGQRGVQHFNFRRTVLQHFDFCQRVVQQFNFGQRGVERFNFRQTVFQHFIFGQTVVQHFNFGQRGMQYFNFRQIVLQYFNFDQTVVQPFNFGQRGVQHFNFSCCIQFVTEQCRHTICSAAKCTICLHTNPHIQCRNGSLTAVVNIQKAQTSSVPFRTFQWAGALTEYWRSGPRLLSVPHALYGGTVVRDSCRR